MKEITVTALKGPLEAEKLTAICRLDAPQYEAFDICRTLFNQNSQGYSYHAFLNADHTIVGHVSLVPFPFEEGVAAKVAAFAIAPQFQRRSVAKKAAAVALLDAALSLAKEDDIKTFCFLSDKNVRAIASHLGCSLLKRKVIHYSFKTSSCRAKLLKKFLPTLPNKEPSTLSDWHKALGVRQTVSQIGSLTYTFENNHLNILAWSLKKSSPFALLRLIFASVEETCAKTVSLHALSSSLLLKRAALFAGFKKHKESLSCYSTHPLGESADVKVSVLQAINLADPSSHQGRQGGFHPFG